MDDPRQSGKVRYPLDEILLTLPGRRDLGRATAHIVTAFAARQRLVLA